MNQDLWNIQYATFICFIACLALPVLRQRTASIQHLIYSFVENYFRVVFKHVVVHVIPWLSSGFVKSKFQCGSFSHFSATYVLRIWPREMHVSVSEGASQDGRHLDTKQAPLVTEVLFCERCVRSVTERFRKVVPTWRGCNVNIHSRQAKKCERYRNYVWCPCTVNTKALAGNCWRNNSVLSWIVNRVVTEQKQ